MRIHFPTYSMNKRSFFGLKKIWEFTNHVLLWQEAFEIEPTSGVIKVKSGLSRDSAAEIDFNVIVRDVNAENNKEQTAKGDNFFRA